MHWSAAAGRGATPQCGRIRIPPALRAKFAKCGLVWGSGQTAPLISARCVCTDLHIMDISDAIYLLAKHRNL
jgi:hypothetical protein